MVAFNFKPEFADMIRKDRKVQTVRKARRCAAGNTMHLYTGQRTASCVLIRKVLCVVVDYCHLAPDGITFGNKDKHPGADDFARLDGFRDYPDMLAWFRRQYGTDHFIGHVHRWTPTDPTV